MSASVSKHRQQDTLPVHPQLIPVLREFFSRIKPGEFLFPKLARRRTWKMVKHDLGLAGIPYVTEDGVADFHAVGRHTYITELIRNGASLPEAMKLARHSDIKMTMKYTHIGLEDQANALAALPDPRQYIGSTSGVLPCPSKSQRDTILPSPNDKSVSTTAEETTLSVTDSQKN